MRDLQICAAAIRDSSSVSLSSLFSPSPISVRPVSFTNFSERPSVNILVVVHETLTHMALFNLLCPYPKNGENLDHYLNNYVHHLRGQGHFSINLETTEEHRNALKDIDKGVLACSSILGCLRGVGVTTIKKGYALKGGLRSRKISQ